MNPLFFIIAEWYEKASSKGVMINAVVWTALVFVLALVLPPKGSFVAATCGGFCCVVLWCLWPLKRREEREDLEVTCARKRDRAGRGCRGRRGA